MINTKIAKEQWMPCPKIETDYPGLTYIYSLDEIIIAKKTDALHKVIGIEGECYTIFNNQRQKVFLAVQEIHNRKHNLKIFNNYGNEVIQVKNSYGVCLKRALVYAPPENFVGSVEKLLPCLNIFLVRNHEDEVILKVKTRRCSLVEYDILSDVTTIGFVKKKWRKRTVLIEKSIEATFPVQMDITHKAVLIGACFLIGFL